MTSKDDRRPLGLAAPDCLSVPTELCCCGPVPRCLLCRTAYDLPIKNEEQRRYASACSPRLAARQLRDRRDRPHRYTRSRLRSALVASILHLPAGGGPAALPCMRRSREVCCASAVRSHRPMSGLLRLCLHVPALRPVHFGRRTQVPPRAGEQTPRPRSSCGVGEARLKSSLASSAGEQA